MRTRPSGVLRVALVGSLVCGGALSAFVSGALPASAAAVVQTISVGNAPCGISSDDTHVWVANAEDNSVTGLNASDGSVVQTIGMGNSPWGVSSDGTHVWVANVNDNTVTELDATGGEVGLRITTSSLPSAAPGAA